MTHLFQNGGGGFAQGTILSLFRAYFEENSIERKQSADPYALDPPGSRFVLTLVLCIIGKLPQQHLFLDLLASSLDQVSCRYL